jgi:hypothetical protein
MLDFFSIFRRNGAHLVGKKTLEIKKDCHFQSFGALSMQKKKLICINL